MKSLFRCPLCGTPLEREETRWLCPNRHSFDRAAAGYVHLLPANKKHSKDPGDDKAMVAARSSFLDKGYYAPLRDSWRRRSLPGCSAPAGCSAMRCPPPGTCGR